MRERAVVEQQREPSGRRHPPAGSGPPPPAAGKPRTPPPVQVDDLSPLLARAVRNRRLLQRVRSTVADTGQTLYLRWGAGEVNTEAVPAQGDRPIVIELMTHLRNVALAKVDEVAAVVNNQGRASQARIGIVILYNARVRAEHIDADNRFRGNWTIANAYAAVVDDCRAIADRMEERGVMGAAIPAIWSPTGEAEVYPLPYLEMRARLTLHPATQHVVEQYMAEAVPVVRSMDADVSDDPLLLDRTPGMNKLDDVWDGTVLSGGYDWDPAPKPAAFWGEANDQSANVVRWNTRWTSILTKINEVEHAYRRYLLTTYGAQLLYWPEPNTYMSATDRRATAGDLLAEVKPKTPQMRESIFYVKKYATASKLTGVYDKRLKTTKPAKDAYFTDLRDLIKSADGGTPSVDKLQAVVEGIRQTHLSPSHASDIQKSSWYDVQSPYATDQFEVKRKHGVKLVTDHMATVLV